MELAHSNRGQFLQVVLKLCERLPIRIYYRRLKINVITIAGKHANWLPCAQRWQSAPEISAKISISVIFKVTY